MGFAGSAATYGLAYARMGSEVEQPNLPSASHTATRVHYTVEAAMQCGLMEIASDMPESDGKCTGLDRPSGHRAMFVI